ncbi:MAG: aminotransferase class V-fold PLP-dependent enzyme [Acidobacteriota bacterium]
MLERVRTETPLVASGAVHLNNAGASPPPQPVLDAVSEYQEFEAVHGGYESRDLRADDIDAAYDAVAELLGCRRRNVALVENATAGFVQALLAFDWKPGDVVLTTRHDYTSNFLQFLSLERRRGVRCVVAPDRPEGGVDPDRLGELIEEHRPRLVSLSWMPTNSGLVQDAAAVGVHCRARNVPYLVDACQTVGQLPIDVEVLGCDFLSATGRKFLRGPRGTGMLFVSDRQLEAGAHPLTLDLHGATWTGPRDFELQPDARRFENWEFNYSLVLGLGAAARYALELGIERVAERSTSLAARVRTLAEEAGLRVLDEGPELGAIVTLDVRDHRAEELVDVLRRRRIHTSSQGRESAVLDLEAKGVDQLLRISPHYFNTDTEIEHAVEQVCRLLQS